MFGDKPVEHVLVLPSDIDDSSSIIVQCRMIDGPFSPLGCLSSGGEENKRDILPFADFNRMEYIVFENFNNRHEPPPRGGSRTARPWTQAWFHAFLFLYMRTHPDYVSRFRYIPLFSVKFDEKTMSSKCRADGLRINRVESLSSACLAGTLYWSPIIVSDLLDAVSGFDSSDVFFGRGGSGWLKRFFPPFVCVHLRFPIIENYLF